MKPIAEFKTFVTLQLPSDPRERSKIMRMVNKYHTGLEEFALGKDIPPGRDIDGKATSVQKVHQNMHRSTMMMVTVLVMEDGNLKLSNG